MRKFIALTAAVFILIFSANSAFAHNNINYELCDPVTDIIYNISYYNKKLSVELSGEVLGQTVIDKITGVSVFDNIIYIYYADNLNKSLFIYIFDFYNDSISSFAIDKDAIDNFYCFAATSPDKVYFVSAQDNKRLCIYENGNLTEVDFKAEINQIICSGQQLMVITSKDTYLYSQSEVKKCDSPFSVPVKYTGGGTLKDADGNIYGNYEDEPTSISETKHIEITDVSTAISNTDADDIKSNTSDLIIDFYVVESGTTVSKIKKAFADSEIAEVRKADGKIIESGKVGTGTTLTFKSGNVVTVIIYGEVTGEGNINSRDLKALLNHLCGKEILKGNFLIAADIDNDGKITTKDALMTANMY